MSWSMASPEEIATGRAFVAELRTKLSIPEYRDQPENWRHLAANLGILGDIKQLTYLGAEGGILPGRYRLVPSFTPSVISQ